MKDQDLVSVIVPSYNYGQFLEETVNSVLNQSYLNIECLIIDDGSQDNTKIIGEYLEKKDSRVKYFYQDNSGTSAAKNHGLSRSKGQYIQFLDADDLISKNKIFNQLEVLKSNKEIDIIYSENLYFDSNNPNTLYKDFDKKNKEWMPKVRGSGRPVLKQLLKANIMTISAPLMRKSVFHKLTGFDKELNAYEDWDLWIRAAENNFVFHYFHNEETQTYIRLHTLSATNNGTKFIGCLAKLYHKHFKILSYNDFDDLLEFYNRQFKKNYFNLVSYYEIDIQKIEDSFKDLPFSPFEIHLLNSKRSYINKFFLKGYAKLC